MIVFNFPLGWPFYVLPYVCVGWVWYWMCKPERMVYVLFKKNANKQQPGLWLFVQVSAWLTILRVGIRMCWMGVVLNVQGVNLSAWFVFSLFQTYLSVWQGDADVQGTGKWWSCRGDMLLWFCYGSCPRDEWSTLPSTTCVAVADRHDFDRVSFSSFFY